VAAQDRGGSADDPPDARTAVPGVFFGNFLFTLCMITGVSLTSAVSAGVIMAAIPAAVAVFSWIFLKEKANARTWWAIALAVAGIALLALAPATRVHMARTRMATACPRKAAAA
jgi:drug/metabolite transporter (DMT)-like permease